MIQDLFIGFMQYKLAILNLMLVAILIIAMVVYASVDELDNIRLGKSEYTPEYVINVMRNKALGLVLSISILILVFNMD